MAIYLFYLVYFIIITFFYLNKKKKNRNNKKYLICAFLPLILIAGLRSENVGIDTKQFTDAFKTIVKMDPSSFGKLRYEYGFSYLCWVLGKLSIEPKILIFSTSFFINFSVARFIYKNSENIPFSTVLYILCNFFFSYMNIMRQAIAIAIILWGYEYLKKNKYIRFCIFVMIASLFHGSAILALIFIFLKKFEYNKYFIGIVFCVSIISILFGKNLFMLFASISPRLFNYVGGNFDKENYVAALLNFIVYLVSYIFGFICLKKSSDDIFKNKENKNNILVGIMAMTVIFSALTMRVSLFNRFTPYFSIFMIIWLSNSVSKIKNINSRFIYILIIILLFFLYWMIIMVFRPEWYGAVPYIFY